MSAKTVEKSVIQEKFVTKRGLHEFLTVECDLFLPPLQNTNHNWLMLIWQDKKKVRIICYNGWFNLAKVLKNKEATHAAYLKSKEREWMTFWASWEKMESKNICLQPQEMESHLS
jgi:hypothetical protein